MRIGWLSTGRDQAAGTLLAEVVGRARRDGIAFDIAAVFCDRRRGESAESDRLLGLAEQLHIPAVMASSRESWGAAQAEGVERARWRETFHVEVMRLLEPFGLDVLVMAGYMLIVSPAMCRRYALLNLHPALPSGPTGIWQDVIWTLLEEEATETGAMINLATSELDRGPVVALCRFSLRGPDWEPLWAQFREKRRTLSVAEIARLRVKASRCSPRSAVAGRPARSRSSTRRSAASPTASSRPRTAASSRSRRACPSTSRSRSSGSWARRRADDG